MKGKKVAIVEIDAEATSRKIIEVALINQLVERGTFILVAKEDVEAARISPELKATDWQGIARKAGADYALKVKTLEFFAEEKQGYSKEVTNDSQLAADRGDDGKTERLYKVRALDGRVRFEMSFTELSKNDTREAVASASDRVVAESKTSAAKLPPRLRFLESLSQKAFKEFFEQYQ